MIFCASREAPQPDSSAIKARTRRRIGQKGMVKRLRNFGYKVLTWVKVMIMAPIWQRLVLEIHTLNRPNHFAMKMILRYAAAMTALSVCTACSLDVQLENREERLLGAWYFDKAWYKDDRALFRNNVIDEFEGDVIEFFDDYAAVYDDAGTRELYWGDWTLSAFRGGDDDVDFLLDMEFYNERDRLVYDFLSNVTLLTRNKLNITVHEPSGIFTFRLRRE